MDKLEYYRVRDYAMYGEPAWWGILCLDRSTKKGRALLLSGVQNDLKIFLEVEKFSEEKKYSDSFVKNFSGTIMYMSEIEFPGKKKTADLEKKLFEWIDDKTSKSFQKLLKDFQQYNAEVPAESYFKSVKKLEKISTRDPWAYFRYYWSDKKKSGTNESFFFSDEDSLYAKEVEDDGEPGSFELEKT